METKKKKKTRWKAVLECNREKNLSRSKLYHAIFGKLVTSAIKHTKSGKNESWPFSVGTKLQTLVEFLYFLSKKPSKLGFCTKLSLNS